MNKRALIIGYGRAGQRHGRILDELGIGWIFCDPNVEHPPRTGRISWEVIRENLDILHCDYSFAVIATPPALHLSQIRQCLDAGLSVLCEKPLCALGQLDEAKELLKHPNADKVMVAYNFRHHPAIIAARGKPPQWFTCWQDRELPEWGLLLDHVSHDLDIVRFLCQEEVGITEANYYPPGTFDHDTRRQMWEIHLQVIDDTLGIPIRIRESVGTYPERKARLEYWDGAELDIDADPAMYKAMWEAFLAGQYEPSLEEAIKTQELLEECWRLANVKMEN